MDLHPSHPTSPLWPELSGWSFPKQLSAAFFDLQPDLQHTYSLRDIILMLISLKLQFCYKINAEDTGLDLLILRNYCQVLSYCGWELIGLAPGGLKEILRLLCTPLENGRFLK